MSTHKYIIQLAPAAEELREDLLRHLGSRDPYPGDAGLDLANLRGDMFLEAGTFGTKIPLGINVRVRKNIGTTFRDWPWQLVARSSTSYETPLRLSNSVGVMDAGFRGEVVAVVDNPTHTHHTLKHGDVRFQLVLGDMTPIVLPDCRVVVVRGFPETERGDGAFGSTDARLQ